MPTLAHQRCAGHAPPKRQVQVRPHFWRAGFPIFSSRDESGSTMGRIQAVWSASDAVKLLEDLHTGTEAVVQEDGKVGRSSTGGCAARGRALLTDLTSHIVALACADVLALLTDPPNDLVGFFGITDAVALNHRRFNKCSEDKDHGV
eukprot:361784-Chlamydomonas_euryale.AAC.3